MAEGEASVTPQLVKNSEQPRNPSRRLFFKRAGVAAGALAVSQIPDTPRKILEALATQQEAKEKEQSPSITIIDAAPNYSNDEMVRRMLGEKYISKEQLMQEFGQDFEEKWADIQEKYPQALVHKVIDRYFTHGQRVKEVMEKTWESHGIQGDVQIKPLQEAFGPGSVRLISGSEGSFGVGLHFDPKRIIELLKSDTNNVVNMSFQVGNVEMYNRIKVVQDYTSDTSSAGPLGTEDEEGNNILFVGAVMLSSKDGKVVGIDAQGKQVAGIKEEEYKKMQEEEKTKNGELVTRKITEESIVGAYSKEKAEENLTKLFEVCNAYPDKVFVAAAGNSGEDVREALQKLEENRPKNLILVAESTEEEYNGQSWMRATYNVFGADIYVDNSKLGIPSGSSFSTPAIAAHASDLLGERGITAANVREQLIARLTQSETLASRESSPILGNILK